MKKREVIAGNSRLLLFFHGKILPTMTSMDTMLKLFLIKHILAKAVLVKGIISGRN